MAARYSLVDHSADMADLTVDDASSAAVAPTTIMDFVNIHMRIYMRSDISKRWVV